MLQNPIGLHENRATWDEAVSGFAKTMLARDPTLTEDVIQKFGHNMFGGDFVFSVSRDFVLAAALRSCCSPAPTRRTRPRPAPRSPGSPPTSKSRRTGVAPRISPSRSAG